MERVLRKCNLNSNELTLSKISDHLTEFTGDSIPSRTANSRTRFTECLNVLAILFSEGPAESLVFTHRHEVFSLNNIFM
jgi:hypothetical protein